MAKKRIKKKGSSKKLIPVCPSCFGENIIPRFGEGTDYWECKDCGKNNYSILELSGKELENARLTHIDKLREIKEKGFEKVELALNKKENESKKIFWLKVIAILIVIVFILIFVSIFLGLK